MFALGGSDAPVAVSVSPSGAAVFFRGALPW
jgi:hypothetical protein